MGIWSITQVFGNAEDPFPGRLVDTGTVLQGIAHGGY